MNAGSSDADVMRAVDAAAGEPRQAQVAVVFGNRLPEAALCAADLYHSGVVPIIAVTGGVHRRTPGFVEADHHAALLRESGVPQSAILVERDSQSTRENVRLLAPLLRERLGPVRTAVAVVHWYHRRGVVELAKEVASLNRIYTVAYEYTDVDTGERVGRSDWQLTQAAPHVRLEHERLIELLCQPGIDPLVVNGAGWVRTRDQPSACS